MNNLALCGLRTSPFHFAHAHQAVGVGLHLAKYRFNHTGIWTPGGLDRSTLDPATCSPQPATCALELCWSITSRLIRTRKPKQPLPRSNLTEQQHLTTMTGQTLLRLFFLFSFGSTTSLFATIDGAEGAAGKLRLEGRILLESGGSEDVRVSVFCDKVEQDQLSKGSKTFELELALGHTYQLVFTRSGCVTKELVFDTNASADVLKDGVFTFRFQVSLAAAPAVGGFHYSGPVAIIRFNPEEGEFDYDRSYEALEVVKVRPERKESKPFMDPTGAFAAWVELKRTEKQY